MAQIKKLSTELQPLDKLLDSSGDAGTSGQILSSTGSGTNWISASSGTITGSGTTGYIPKWTGSSALGDSILEVNSLLPSSVIIPEYIRHRGDTNTYFGFHSNDTILFATSNNEVMRINSSGNVGIGTTNPQSGGGAAGWLSLNGTAAYSGGIVYTIDSTTKGYSYFESDYLKQQAQSGFGHKFIVDGTTTAMTILDSGNVGIGTTSPLMNLQVHGTTSTVTAIGISNTSTGASRLYMDASNGDFSGSDYMWIGQNNDKSGEIFMAQSSGSFHIKTQPSGTVQTNFTVTQAGLVGIGTTSPAKTLEVDSGAVSDIAIFGNDNGSFVVGYTTNLASIDLSATSQKFRIRQGSSVPFTIDDSQRVGIGTTSPNEALEVSGNIRASGSYKVGATDVISSGRRFFAADGSASAPAYSFSGRTDTGMYAADHISNDRIWFTVDGGDRFYIDANGITSVSNVYTGVNGQFRNYSGIWRATTGTSGNGFIFTNTADSSDVLSITSSSSGATASVATFSGKVKSAQTASGDDNAVLTTKSYVDGLVTGVTRYMGLWDASDGTGGSPDLTASTYKVPGYYFIVSVAGDAEPNGAGTEPDTWHVGDWVIWSDQATDAWQKIDNTSVLSGTGTANKLALWNGDESLTNSRFSQNATTNIITGPGNSRTTLYTRNR